MNMIENSHSLMCPYCGERLYQKLYSTTTALYDVVGGELINEQNAKTITHCYCLNCKKDFTY